MVVVIYVWIEWPIDCLILLFFFLDCVCSEFSFSSFHSLQLWTSDTQGEGEDPADQAEQ